MSFQVQGVPTNPILPRAGGVIDTGLHLALANCNKPWPVSLQGYQLRQSALAPRVNNAMSGIPQCVCESRLDLQRQLGDRVLYNIDRS